MYKILITGGAGFIGSNMANALTKDGYSVTVVDILSSQIHGDEPDASPLFKSLNNKIDFVRGDVRDRSLMEGLLAEHDILLHLAAETGTGQSMYMIGHYTDVNIQGTSVLLDILSSSKNRRIRRFVVASSRAIYGEGKYVTTEGCAVFPPPRRLSDMRAGMFEPRDPRNGETLSPIGTDEDSLIRPSSIYGITKYVQEQLVMTACPMLGIEPVALRYQNVYGPGQSLTNPYTGILSIFSSRLLQGKDVEIFEDGHESRDFVYIDDVVDATMRSLLEQGAAGYAFNVGSGVATSVLKVVRLLIDELRSSSSFNISGNFRQGDIRHNFADLSRIRDRLGFEPSVGFEDGIRRFAQWVVSQGRVESGYEQSISELRERGLVVSSSLTFDGLEVPK